MYNNVVCILEPFSQHNWTGAIFRLNMGEPFTTDFKITTREPSFVLHNAEQDDSKNKAHSSSKYLKVYFYYFYGKTVFDFLNRNVDFCIIVRNHRY